MYTVFYTMGCGGRSILWSGIFVGSKYPFRLFVNYAKQPVLRHTFHLDFARIQQSQRVPLDRAIGH